ncbi:MAG: CHAP domain-containing protein [Candidatus Berkelbacteria bacterium]|nr:CHAP domain-containing protein [Candidatus Berkelbacteria bacterium]
MPTEDQQKDADQNLSSDLETPETRALGVVGNFFVRIFRWYKPSLLPHFALALALLFVLVLNYNNYIAKAASNELVSLDVSTENNILSSVNAYSCDLLSVDTNLDFNLAAVNTSDGFIQTSVPIETQITARVEPLPDNSQGTVNYVIRSGDTLSKLATAFGVNQATLKYTNNLTNVNTIKPGATLKVPKRGFAVSTDLIAKQEAQNTASSQSKRTAIAKQSLAALAASHQKKPAYNGYPYGWCTYYVASKRQVPSNWGNAGQWLKSAQSAGWSTGSIPVPGAIMVTNESFWGHVTYVERVDGDQVVVSEMNGTAGFGLIDLRAYSKSSSLIKGFIY